MLNSDFFSESPSLKPFILAGIHFGGAKYGEKS
jgi:hypothetical protein